MRVPSLDIRIWRLYRQILTSKDGTRTERDNHMKSRLLTYNIDYVWEKNILLNIYEHILNENDETKVSSGVDSVLISDQSAPRSTGIHYDGSRSPVAPSWGPDHYKYYTLSSDVRPRAERVKPVFH